NRRARSVTNSGLRSKKVDDAPGMVTRVLQGAKAGDPGASAQLLPLVYEELRVLARSRLAATPGRGAGNTLQPTALVHEAYLRLVKGEEPSWNSRGHFFAAAPQAMRQILVDQARQKAALKHGGGVAHVEAMAEALPIEEPREDLIALDRALVEL